MDEPVFARLDTALLRVRDLEASRAWYEQKLGLKAVHVDKAAALVVFDLGGAPLTLWQWPPGQAPAAPPAGWAFPIFGVADARAAHARLVAGGLSPEAVQEGPGVRWFRFHDLDGNVLEACQVL